MQNLPLPSLLDDAGLNRQHVFDLAALPGDLLEPLAPTPRETQLLLFGHAGRRLWDRVQAEGMATAHPVDGYSMRTVEHWLRLALPTAQARFVYPIGLPQGRHVALQRLGSLAGWHHASPFMVGVDAEWGSWFAYRAVVLTDTQLPPSVVEDRRHPCLACSLKPCITACVGHALDHGSMDSDACMHQRLKDGSPCAQACPARQACPVGAEHRYDESQIRHGAAHSLAAIRRHLAIKPVS